jgi:hypothetical protein
MEKFFNIPHIRSKHIIMLPLHNSTFQKKSSAEAVLEQAKVDFITDKTENYDNRINVFMHLHDTPPFLFSYYLTSYFFYRYLYTQ